MPGLKQNFRIIITRSRSGSVQKPEVPVMESASLCDVPAPAYDVPLPLDDAGKFHFGFFVDHRWVLKFAATEIKRQSCARPLSNELAIYESVLDELEKRTGIAELSWGRCVPERFDGDTCHDHVPDWDYRVLSVFSSGVESYGARPSKEQMDKLTELVGSSPTWWRAQEEVVETTA